MSDEPDLTNLRWFFDHLELRDPDAAHFAKELVYRRAGWEVTSFFGPVQMDVWGLVVSSGDWSVRFGVERGFSDGILVRGPDGESSRLPSAEAAYEWLERW